MERHTRNEFAPLRITHPILRANVEPSHLLLNRKAEFARNLTQKMLAYALGRGLEIHDLPTVRKITRALADSGYRSETLITEIMKSYPFQYRRRNQVQLTQTGN